MMTTFRSSFLLSNAYSINSFIFRLKSLPVIKHLLPSSLYASDALKLIAGIIISICKIAWAFLSKALYLGIMVLLPTMVLKGNQESNYISILLVLSLVGAFSNGDLLNPTKEKYYCVVLMGIDAKKYALTSLCWFLVKNFITFLPASLLIGQMAGVRIFICVLMPVLIVAMKVVGSFIGLRFWEKKKILIKVNSGKFIWGIILGGTVLSYVLPLVGLSMSVLATYISIVVVVFAALLGMVALWKSQAYKQMYKKILTTNNVIFNATEAVTKQKQKNVLSQITDEEIRTGQKKGYEFFNEAFIQRHRKILTTTAKQLAVFFAMGLIGIMVATRFHEGINIGINRFILTFLPYFVFIMYLFNRGSTITQAMFMNCDHSMLAYRFYRQPEAILQLFKERLKTLIKINLLPAVVLASGLPILLFMTGGTNNPLNYLLVFISILAMSVFFSVHHLVLYYLLQPYNVHMEAKSSTYSVANWVTYIACYMCMKLKAPTVIFASLTIVFSILYICIALYLVYKYAPKRFKLK